MIFDYFDDNHAITNAMFRRRLAGYKELGYTIEMAERHSLMVWRETGRRQKHGIERPILQNLPTNGAPQMSASAREPQQSRRPRAFSR